LLRVGGGGKPLMMVRFAGRRGADWGGGGVALFPPLHIRQMYIYTVVSKTILHNAEH